MRVMRECLRAACVERLGAIALLSMFVLRDGKQLARDGQRGGAVPVA